MGLGGFIKQDKIGFARDEVEWRCSLGFRGKKMNWSLIRERAFKMGVV